MVEKISFVSPRNGKMAEVRVFSIAWDAVSNNISENNEE